MTLVSKSIKSLPKAHLPSIKKVTEHAIVCTLLMMMAFKLKARL